MPKLTRTQIEMKQFDDADYADTFLVVNHVTDDTVCVTMPDTSIWMISRSSDFLQPPMVIRNDEIVEGLFCGGTWSPALTSVKVLLMAYALTPE